MKMSTKGRYGLRAMLDLAIHSAGDHVALKNIAERQNISDAYLEQVFSTLRKAGLVKSIKGAQGGYVLGDSPAVITVGQILRALEGDLLIVDQEKEDSADNTVEYCINENVWSTINKSINAVVDAITLEDLMQQFQKLCGNTSMMYYI